MRCSRPGWHHLHITVMLGTAPRALSPVKNALQWHTNISIHLLSEQKVELDILDTIPTLKSIHKGTWKAPLLQSWGLVILFVSWVVHFAQCPHHNHHHISTLEEPAVLMVVNRMLTKSPQAEPTHFPAVSRNWYSWRQSTAIRTNSLTFHETTTLGKSVAHYDIANYSVYEPEKLLLQSFSWRFP